MIKHERDFSKKNNSNIIDIKDVKDNNNSKNSSEKTFKNQLKLHNFSDNDQKLTSKYLKKKKNYKFKTNYKKLNIKKKKKSN